MRISLIELEGLLRSNVIYRKVAIHLLSTENLARCHRHCREPPGHRRSVRRAAASVFSRAGSRVCMTDSGAIESDLERFQKTFSRSPTYKAALSPRERRAVRHETSRTTIETRRTYTHVRTIATKRERRRRGTMRRGRRRTARCGG